MAKTVAYQSLDELGMTAAAYPDEDVLWVQGPPINDPGAQGVAGVDDDTLYEPPVPRSASDVAATEEFIDEVMNGETPNGAYEEIWVNTQEYGPTGYGPYNAPGLFESGHTQNIVSNPSAEQGWGVGPARAWAHYPTEDNPNPFRNKMVHCRNGEFPWVVADTALYYRTQLAWEQQWDGYKFRSPVAPVVPVASAVPFSATVPTYSGGPSPHPGVDVPNDDSMIYGGVYPTQ